MRIFSPTRPGSLSAIAAIAVLLAPGWASAAAERMNIGAVDLVRIWASGTLPETSRRDLFVADKVFGNEVVETVRDGALHLRFTDDTEFKLGSDSRATLDTFIYDQGASADKLTLSLKEGLFRLKTGRIKKEGILLITPVAQIEVHGTDVTIKVLPDGTTRVSVSLGEALIRPRAGQIQNALGSPLVLTPGSDGGQVAPDGSVGAYTGDVAAGDSGILAGADFEAEPTVGTTNMGDAEEEIFYQSASAGQTGSALSAIAIFDRVTQTALRTTVTGEGLFAAAAVVGENIRLAALQPSQIDIVTDAIADAVTQAAASIGGPGGIANGNGGFETGNLSGFVVSGNVAIITSFGPLTPPQGQFMAFLSTGGAAVFSTGAAAVPERFSVSTLTTEPFALPDGVSFIGFAYNLLSDSSKDDTLVAIINSTQETVIASVDSSTFQDATGTGFARMTGFESAQLDVSQFAGTGDLTVEFQVFDLQASGSDTTVLLDALVLQ